MKWPFCIKINKIEALSWPLDFQEIIRIAWFKESIQNGQTLCPSWKAYHQNQAMKRKRMWYEPCSKSYKTLLNVNKCNVEKQTKKSRRLQVSVKHSDSFISVEMLSKKKFIRIYLNARKWITLCHLEEGKNLSAWQWCRHLMQSRRLCSHDRLDEYGNWKHTQIDTHPPFFYSQANFRSIWIMHTLHTCEKHYELRFPSLSFNSPFE